MSERTIRTRCLGVITALLLLAAVAGPTGALADPGRAGLTDASKAVYPRLEPQHLTAGSLSNSASGSGPGSVAPQALATSNPSSLPFTGLIAPVILGAGLLALISGLILRQFVAHRRGQDAPQTP